MMYSCLGNEIIETSYEKANRTALSGHSFSIFLTLILIQRLHETFTC